MFKPTEMSTVNSLILKNVQSNLVTAAKVFLDKKNLQDLCSYDDNYLQAGYNWY